MLKRRHYRKTSTSPMNELDKSEASFACKLRHTAKLNGWRIDLGDLSKTNRDPRFFAHLQAIAPTRGKTTGLRVFLDFLRDRADMIFSFGYHTHDSRQSQRGFFDETFIHPRRGIVLFVETKKVGSYPTIEQRLWYAAAKCVEDNANGAVLVRIWRPTDWPEIVEVLGGIDPYSL